MSGRLFTDSTNAKSATSRQGPTKKLRHIDVRHHFIQKLVADKKLGINNIEGTKNVADLGTKYFVPRDLKVLKARVGVGEFETFEEFGPLFDDERKIWSIERDNLTEPVEYAVANRGGNLEDTFPDLLIRIVLVVANRWYEIMILLIGMLIGKRLTGKTKMDKKVDRIEDDKAFE